MDRHEILATVARVTRETLRLEESHPLDEGTRFLEDLGADSLDLISLVMGLEEAFGESIPEDEARSLLTVGAAVDHIAHRMGPRES